MSVWDEYVLSWSCRRFEANAPSRVGSTVSGCQPFPLVAKCFDVKVSQWLNDFRRHPWLVATLAYIIAPHGTTTAPGFPPDAQFFTGG